MFLDERISTLYEAACRVGASLDLKTTLKAVVEAAAELIPCALAEVSLWDEAAQMLVLQALHADPERAYPIGRAFPPGEGYTGWVVRTRQALLVPDVEAFQDLRPHLLEGEKPFKAYAGVPLLAGETLVGTLVLIANQAGVFTPEHLQILKTLAMPAAVAIRNARNYEELAQRHQELSALYAIAEAVNQPLELHSLLERALDSVIAVTRADGGGIRLLDAQTGELMLAAQRGLSETYAQGAARFPLSREIVGEVARTRQPSLAHDMWNDPRVSPEVRELLQQVGHRSLAQVPLLAQEHLVGTLGITAREPDFFDEEDLQLLNAIGQQLGIAIDNAQLFGEIRRQARKLAAINAVITVVNQALPLGKILEQVLATVVEVTETDVGVIRLLNQGTGNLEVTAYQGVTAEHIKLLERLGIGKGAGIHLREHHAPLVVDSSLVQASTPASLPEEIRTIRTYVVVPLWIKDQPIGTLGVSTRRERKFTSEDLDMLSAIGGQIAIAIENVRLLEAEQRSQQEAMEAERLAAVGRVATGVAHDLRSPLGGILRSAEFLARPDISPDTRQKLSQSIVSLSRRLINTSQQILDYVQKEQIPLKRTSCMLAEFLNEVLSVLEVDFSDRGIEVIKRFRYKGVVWMDGDRMAQVIYNIAANARDAMPQGGKFVVSTRKLNGHVELRFSDTGPGVSEKLGEKIFEPFTSFGKRHGAGLGLAIARRIVEEHGGTLRLERKKRPGATFLVTLPV